MRHHLPDLQPFHWAQQLQGFADHDVICLSEVRGDSLAKYARALRRDFRAINGTTGRNDRLQIFVNKRNFTVLEQRELMRHRNFTLNNGTHRSPLYVRLQHRRSRKSFIVMTNHLARGNAELRQEQASGLREWARDQSAPVIAIGDFSMDFDFKTQRGNKAFDEMLKDNVWMWVRPETLIDTNWSDRDGDGRDNYPDSMLDFAFVSGEAKTWNPVCEVIVRDGDFPDDERTSDHRPVRVVVGW